MKSNGRWQISEVTGRICCVNSYSGIFLLFKRRLFVFRLQTIAKIRDALSHPFAELRETGSAKEDHDNHEDEEKLRETESEHGAMI